MRKRAFLAILMVVVIAATTSCSLIYKDPEVDAATTIIEVAGKTYTKAEVQQAVQNNLDYQEYIYSMYGYSFDKTDATTIADTQTTTINQMIQNAVVAQKETEYGSTTFTDEELAEMQTTVDDQYASYTTSVQSSYFADTELTGDELTAAIDAKMVELGYNKDTMLESAKTTKSQEKLKAEVVKDVAVTDEEIQTEYDSRVAEAKSTYADNASAYASSINSGSTVYTVPEGYRYVKNILVQLASEDSTAISDLNTQISSKQTEIDTANTSIAALPEDATTDTEEQAATRTTLTEQLATLQGELDELNKQLTEKKEAAYAAIQPKIDEIQAKLAEEGADFDAIMEEYGEDTGMKNEPAKTNGYPVCEGCTVWASEFTAASMALAKIGDVSEPFRTSFGIHIVKYVSDIAAGDVPLDSVKDVISADLLTTKQDDLYNTTVEQWVAEANAVTHAELLAD